MPSSYTTSIRVEKQFTGENVNTWGDRLNTALDRIDFAIAGWTAVTLNGEDILSSSNSASDEARSAMLKFTGGAGPFAVTIPSVSKTYILWNATGGVVQFTTGAGAAVFLDAGDKVMVFCDGTNVYEPGYSGLGLKAYVSSVAAGGAGGNVPSTLGNPGKWLTNNGVISSWSVLVVADLSDYVSDQTAKRTTATALAVAFAVAL